MKLIFRDAKNLRKSNAPWAGNVPDYWSAASLRWKTRIYAGGTPDRSKLEFWENGNIPWLNSGSVNQYVIKKPSALITEEALRKSSTRWVPKGALLLALAGQGKTKGMVARLAIDSTCNQSVAAIVPNWDLNGIFLHYFLQDNYQNIRNLAGGDLRDGLNLDMLASIACPIPPLSEQRLIAAYLNRETAKIDKLIAKQQKLIKLLQEKRQAVISQAVTKGLDPNVKMKDSGVEWLGAVPEHWTVSKISRFFKIKAGGDLKEEFFSPEESEEYPYPIYTNSTKADATYGFSTSYFFPGNSITVTGRGEIGFATYRDKPFDAIIRLLVLTPICGEYCKFAQYFINSQLRFSESATAIAQLSTQQLAPHTFLYPPPEEQKVISDFLDIQVKKTQGLLDRIELNKQLLQERRQALITAAVTGKIDVRGLVSDEEVAALDADPVLETTEENFESEVVEADYITEEE